MDLIDLSHRGWGGSTVPVRHARTGLATLMEVKGGPLSSFYVYGVIDTPDRLERGALLFTQTYGGTPGRTVVPRKYTHVRIVKPVSGGSVLPRWRLGFGNSATLPELRTASGKRPAVLRHTGPETRIRLETGEGYANVDHLAFDGGNARRVRFGPGPFRGPVSLPGPGLIMIDCLVDWTITLA
ncbi:hypothetical protein [Streptomyces yaizuensis]|uniref:Uncharacterized protein n=1 Tax=Streptomyces yaizuensis TaxID=2989713 RepID=A0ABQ5P3L5_9ACTN|nr:hypothetical protein [Streptomyces sp. YSPA8]GLF97182.1 hypothetical protein SYYSPA8_22815 [Streptomyces sp. YSPA8]